MNEPNPMTRAVTFLVADLDPTADWVAAVLTVHGCHRSWRQPAGGAVAVFAEPGRALAAAGQLRATAGHDPALRSRLRIALHLGTEDGPGARRCAGLWALANGGQTLLSAAAADAIEPDLPEGTALHDLGSHRLHDLSAPERVFELRAAGGAGSLPLRSIDRVPNNLPVQLTGFVGRDVELGAVRTRLAGERLLTLTGPGGCGKTRLAARAAAESADRWPDGVWWVELGTLTDPALVAETIATATGVLAEPGQGAARSLARQLRDRRMLLCLDNCEHLLEGAADTTDELLRSCPEVAVLATSREPLGVQGEAVWPVPPMAEKEARSLFVERARLVLPSFTPDADAAAAVDTICLRLDGIPLAIELAAAWLRTLSPRQIAEGLDDRFALLVRGPRGAVPRQQTLATSIAWSHELLTEQERLVFRRLAVFPSGCTLAAARAVCACPELEPGAVLGVLARLVDKSLVLTETMRDRARYRMLETIREYAAERLREAGEVESTRDRHLDHYLAAAEEAEPERDQDKEAWRQRMEAEYGNLRAALEWGLAAADPERGRRLAAQLPWLWHVHRHGHEGIRFLQHAVGRAPADRSPLQARLLTGIALVADTASPLDLEFDAAQRALEIATELGEERLRCLPLALSAVGQFYTDFAAGLALNEEALRSATAAGDAFGRNSYLALRGIILHLRDQHEEAQELMRQAVTGLLPRGDRGVAATVLGFRAVGALCTGSPKQARELAEEGVAVAEPLADYHRVGSSRSVLALVHGLTGDAAGGLRLLDPVLRLVEGARSEVFVPGMARVLGILHHRQGEHAEAVRWLEQEAWSTDRGAATYLAAQARPALGEALRQLGRAEQARRVLDEAVALARTLGMPRALADALDQQGHLAAAEDPDRALELHHEALGLRVEHGLSTQYTESLDALAVLAARRGEAAEAARVLAASSRARADLGFPRSPTEDRAHERVATTLRQTLGERAFAEAGARGAELDLAEAVTYVRRARGPRDRPSAGWASLTPTELEVVRLAVDGLNNPEIGSRLFMSRGTVKTHLSHVYAKLGVTNRTELATLASKENLPG
ncbi:helix-turn-helix transcriptional regulator [Amycolatopsis aidingensis]|uniref:helix-turn-helix transcriptional regulator n=1 Tax=Amycolatopsis aidingensis TaxID=2842453 RepID=UPI001E548490|nr:LuxR C-terminal-related transcriptional regulator [Amycolatopsis aidingensis]